MASRLTLTVTILMVLISIPFSMRTIQATNGEYNIEYVKHKTTVLYDGNIAINDTIKITGQVSEGFLIGFPHKYGPYILQVIAYNKSDIFPVTTNVPLENRIGFYGVRVEFPHGTPQLFNVGFILSNDLLLQSAQNTTYYLLDFPAFPSLTEPAAVCNGSVSLRGATYLGSTVENFTSDFTYQRQNLPAFAYEPANVTFQMTSGLQLMDIKELKREIRINESGEIDCSDSYHMIYEGQEQPNSIEVILPLYASDPIAEDEFGRTLSDSAFLNINASRYKIVFALPLQHNDSTRFSVAYSLSSQIYTTVQGANSFLNLTSIRFLNASYYIEKPSITLIPPEGARILTYGNYSITRSAFQESLTINLAQIGPFEQFLTYRNIPQVTYTYDPLWLAFRPTLWIWAISIAGCFVVFFWKRPKAPEKEVPTMPVTVTAARLRPEDTRSFVNAYEEKRKMTLDIESLENKVAKGKIPRRRYKVQRKILETRLNSLNRTIAETKVKMRGAGQYADFIRQLEGAETEINEIEAQTRSIEARHNRGDLSLEEYRKLLTDYQRRKDKANTAIDGILLRLREENR
jgi:uncharacterized protein YlxW (UPF0749 family)